MPKGGQKEWSGKRRIGRQARKMRSEMRSHAPSSKWKINVLLRVSSVRRRNKPVFLVAPHSGSQVDMPAKDAATQLVAISSRICIVV